MKVRMKVQISGTVDGQDWPNIGGTIELADNVAADMCANGQAQPVVDVEANVETAVAPAEVELRLETPKVIEAPVFVDHPIVKRGPGRPRKNG